MQIPFIDLSRSVAKIKASVMQDWERCLDQCEFVGGPTVNKLERALEGTMEVKHFINCANGTDALVIGLQAMGIGPGHRVAVPNMTFWAPFEAVVQVGAEPVLVDIDAVDLQMCFEEFTTAHEKFKCDAAIMVHLYGWTSARLGEMRRYCQAQGIKLLEDGAQAYGVKVDGESVYKDATIGTISFYPAKVLGASSDAGGITTGDPQMEKIIRSLCNHGRDGHYTYSHVGWNSRMSGPAANYLYRMMEHMDEFLASRRAGEKFYQEFFAAHQDLVTVHQAPKGVESNGYLSVLVARHKTGDELVELMKVKGVGCARTYPQTLDVQPPAQNALKVSAMDRSHRLSRHVINLPLFAGITMEECQYAAEAMLQALKS